LLFDVKRTKYMNWILGLRQTTFVALFYYQVYETFLFILLDFIECNRQK
jgi:hypothetical protein